MYCNISKYPLLDGVPTIYLGLTRKYFSRLESQFDLVMIMEHFDESMIFLKELLGPTVSLDEMAYFKHNSQSETSRCTFHNFKALQSLSQRMTVEMRKRERVSLSYLNSQ